MYDTFLLKNQKINNKDMYILITDLEKIHKLQKDKIEQLSEKPMNIEDDNFIKTFIQIIEEYIPVKNLRYIPIKTIMRCLGEEYGLQFISKAFIFNIESDKLTKNYIIKNKKEINWIINFTLRNMLKDMKIHKLFIDKNENYDKFIKQNYDKKKIYQFNNQTDYYKYERKILANINSNKNLEKILKYCNNQNIDLYIFYILCYSFITNKYNTINKNNIQINNYKEIENATVNISNKLINIIWSAINRTSF